MLWRRKHLLPRLGIELRFLDYRVCNLIAVESIECIWITAAFLPKKSGVFQRAPGIFREPKGWKTHLLWGFAYLICQGLLTDCWQATLKLHNQKKNIINCIEKCLNVKMFNYTYILRVVVEIFIKKIINLQVTRRTQKWTYNAWCRALQNEICLITSKLTPEDTARHTWVISRNL